MENKKWKFDNKLITIAYYVFAISLGFILSSDGFANISLFKFVNDDRKVIGFTFVIVGLLIAYIFNKKEAKIKEEISNIIKLKLSKVIFGMLLVLVGVVTLLKIGSPTPYLKIYIIPLILVLASLGSIIGILIYDNLEMIKRLGKFLTIGTSILSFLIAALLFKFNKIVYAIIALVIGLAFLALFIYIITAKYRVKKKIETKEIIIK